MLAEVFRDKGLTAIALAYVLEEGLPDRFPRVPIDLIEGAAKRLHDMGYEKVGLWGISKGAELALAAGKIMDRLRENEFTYLYRHLSYDHGSHLFVPLEMPSARFFRGERGRNKEAARKDRMDSLIKTLDFVSEW